MWLIFLLIWNFILFSLFSISSCALPINTNTNKDANLNTNISNYKDLVISSKGSLSPEGSGSAPANEILSDDEDFFPRSVHPDRSSTIDFSGDGPLDHHIINNNNNNGHIVTNPGSHVSTNINTDAHNHGDDEDDTEDTEDDEDDEDDDEGSGDSPHSPSKGTANGGSDFTFSTKGTIITDDDNFKMPIGNKPDATNIDPDSIEGNKDIIIDGSDKFSDNFFPGVVETSTKQNKPNHHDIDHEDGDDHDDLDDSLDDDDHDQDENTLRNDISILGRKQDARPVSFFAQPSMLAAVIGGIVVSLLCAILLAMFIIYRTRKKDEGSYICEPSLTSPVISHYGKGSSNKFYDP